jgi:hypothetical protein
MKNPQGTDVLKEGRLKPGWNNKEYREIPMEGNGLQK